MEIWKPVKGYEGFYEVSDSGQVRSVDRVVIGRKYKGRKLVTQNKRNNYASVVLWKEGKYSTKSIHRLVCEEFLENRDSKNCVNHIDGDKKNNHLSNLEWVTHSENNKHAFENGLNHITDKNRIAISESNTAKKSIPIIRFGNGMEEKRYSSITEASKNESINNSDIARACKGFNKTAGGFNWRYENRRQEA